MNKGKSNYNPIYSFIMFIIVGIIFTIVGIKIFNTDSNEFDKYTGVFFMLLLGLSGIFGGTKLIIKHIKENKRILKLKKTGEVKKAKINNIIKSSHGFFIYASNKQTQYSQEVLVKTDENIKIGNIVNVYEDPEDHHNYRIDIDGNL